MSAPSRSRRVGLVVNALWVVLLTTVAAAVLFLGLFPTQQYFDQRDTIDERRRELAEIEGRIAALDVEIAELETPLAVERAARERFGVVREGEEAYRLHFPADVTPDQLLTD